MVREDLAEEMPLELRPKGQGGRRGSQVKIFGRHIPGSGNNYENREVSVSAGVFEGQKGGQYVRIQ